MLEAMKDSDAILEQEMMTTKEAISGIEAQRGAIEQLMQECREKFATQPEGKQLQSQIKHLSSEVKQLEKGIQDKECQVEAILQEITSADMEIEEVEAEIDSLVQTTRIQVKEIDRELDLLFNGPSQISPKTSAVL